MEPTNQGERPQEVAKLSQVIQIDEGKIQEHLGGVVRSAVEETLNAMLDAEADRLCQAERYERTEARKDTRAGSYERHLHTKAGEVTLKVPKLRNLPFETAIIERCRNRPIEGQHPYVYLDGLWLKRSWGGEVRNVSLLVAIGVNEEGFREVLAVAEGSKEDKASWTAFLRHLKERGLKGVRLFVSDKCLGLVESLGEFYPEAQWQRCAVHFYRNVWTAVPTSKVKEVAAMLKAIHAQEDRAAARQKAEQVVAKLKEMKLADAAALVLVGIEETLYYYAFPREHWRSLRTNNPLERLLREVRRRTRAVGAFPDGKSALMLAAARLRHVAGTKWGTRRYLDMNRLSEASEAA